MMTVMLGEDAVQEHVSMSLMFTSRLSPSNDMIQYMYLR